ncbi:SURF1 family protein [Mycobacterium sp. SMC-4]|uniref:SURF1 family cytochrome oxidase biogenesis protein n=1 Tax=Mycobacterium sp. SMC-4 TaxID=2857059 RepID=UPI0021B30F3A|nr:SURF1 family protein [Mycobacterium sp. SMC-4]UXA16297.1 SURF1 family protein [Mycobacterium sp. SMC-4]
MRRFTFLLQPQWLALYVVVIAFAYLCFTVLAPWQLGKNTTTSQRNDQIARSLDAEPTALTSVLPQQDSSIDDEEWQRVTATGRYLPEAQVVARLRLVEGDPAYEVLVPFVVEDGPTVLVNRGFVRPVGGSGVPEIAPAPAETVTITARLRHSEALAQNRAPFVADGAQQVYSINTEQISALTGVPLTSAYLQLVDDQPGGLGAIPLPHLDAGPFLSYGIQWIAFGVIAPLGVGYFVYSEIKVRRREKALARDADDRGELSAEEKLADRYGRRH